MLLVATVFSHHSVQSVRKNGASEEVEVLFVQDAEWYELVEGAIVLKNARPDVLYFTDRPKRLAGYISRDQVVKIARKSFELVPQNAALVVFTDD